MLLYKLCYGKRDDRWLGTRVGRECIRCILLVRFNEVINAVNDEERAIDIQVKLLNSAYKAFTSSDELTIIATHVYNSLLELAPEVVDYYRGVKRRSIDLAWPVLEKFRELINGFTGYERFRLALRLSIAGNLLDTGVLELNSPEKIDIDSILSIPFSIDYTIEIYNLLRGGGKRILWLFDNAGESIYDIPAIEIIRGFGNKVIGVAKEDPGFQNDLTISDAEYANLGRYLDKIMSTGYSGSSIHLDKISSELKEELERADIVIAKGMAHYEYISCIELGKPVIHLLIPKCNVLARHLGVRKRTLVALLRT